MDWKEILTHPVTIIAIISAIFGGGRWVGMVNSDRKTFKDFMKEIRGKVDEILRRVPPLLPMSSTSPLQLNDLGKEISAELGGAAWAERHLKIVAAKVKDFDAYEIQEHCFDYVKGEVFSDEEKSAIRRSAFNRGFGREIIRQVLAIELRNRLLDLANLEAPSDPTPPGPGT